MASVNALFADDWIRHAVLLEQFKNGEIKRLMAFLNKEVMPSIIAKADKIATRYQKMGYSKLAIARRRKALMKQLRGMEAVVKGGTKLLSARLNGTMSTLAKSEANWAAQALQRRLPLRVNYTMPSPQLLKSALTTKPMTGRFLKDWAKGVGATTAKNVNQAIMVGVAQGEGVETIVRRIRGTAANGFKDGVLQATRNEAAMVTRTAINHVGQHAREAVFAENKDVVERVQWLAVLDSRTSQICASLDSQTYEVNKGPRPPAHPNCRSVMIPVVKPPQGIPGIDSSKLPVGERAAMGGPVPGNMGFGSWLKRQPAPVQNQILGTGKAKLFRRGKVPIEKFSDIGGSGAVRALSLKELEAIEAKLAGVKIPKPKPKPFVQPTPPPPPPKPVQVFEPPKVAPKVSSAASDLGYQPQHVIDGSWTRVGPQAGSNLGGMFTDPTGNAFYVKQAKTADHALNEVLAIRLYKKLGVAVPDVELAMWNGKPAVVSRRLHLQSPQKGSLTSSLIQEDFAADAWLANWDVIGMQFDNALLNASGKVVRIDAGGALKFRAQGSPKGTQFGNNVDELATLRNPHISPQASQIFGTMTEEQVMVSIKKLTSGITEVQIKEVVRSVYGRGKAAKEIRDTLIARRRSLKHQADLMAKKVKEEAVAAKAKAKAAKKLQKEMEKAVGSRRAYRNRTEFNEAWAKWEATLSSEDRIVIREWTGGQYGKMRQAQGFNPLNSSGKPQFTPLDRGDAIRFKVKADRLTRALARSPKYPPREIHRGYNLDQGTWQDLVKSMTRGQDWTMEALASFSDKLQVAEQFARGQFQVFLKVKTSAGSWVKPVSVHITEFESIMMQGTKFRVTGFTTETTTGYGSGAKRLIIELVDA